MPAPTLTRRRLLATAVGTVLVTPAVAGTRLGPEAAGDGVWRGIEFEDQGGRGFQLGSGPAPLTLVAMWAHWCPACLSEMPSLAALAASMGSQVDVLLVSHPEYWERDKAVAQQHRIPHRMATPSRRNAPAVLAAALLQDGAYAVPRSLVVRRDGSVAWRHEGAVDWASAEAVGRMRALAQRVAAG